MTRAGQLRIAYLDGLRGCAILLVVGWHYLGPTFEDYLPYHDRLAWLFPFSVGWVGVELFFLISGYVILLTLDKCRRFSEFMIRRLIRLWPTLSLVAVSVFLLSHVAGEHMPSGRHSLLDLLSSLSLIDPVFWKVLLRRPVRSIDPVFWTLYVEMIFYVVMGFLYFRFGWQRAIAALIALWLVVVVGGPLLAMLPGHMIRRAIEPLHWLGSQYFGWFASGALFLRAQQEGSDRLFMLAIACGLASAVTFVGGVPIDKLSRFALVGCVFLFAGAHRSTSLQQLLSRPTILFVGFVSYPFYLFHSELGVALIGTIGRSLPIRLSQWLPIPIAVLMLMLAYLVERWFERPIILRLQTFHRTRVMTNP